MRIAIIMGIFHEFEPMLGLRLTVKRHNIIKFVRCEYFNARIANCGFERIDEEYQPYKQSAFELLVLRDFAWRNSDRKMATRGVD